MQTLINLAGSYQVVRHTLRPRLRGATGLASFGLQVTGANVIGWIAENTDRLLVNRFWGTAALGEYTAAIALSRAPAGLLVNAVQSVTLSSASRLQNDNQRLGRAYLALLGLITLLTGPLFTLMGVHAPTLVHLIYGERWTNTGLLFAAFCASLPFYSILAVSGPVLWAINVVRPDIYIQVFSFVAVALGFYAMKAFPLEQAVWLIPLIYLLRTVWIYLTLAAHLHFPHRRALRAVTGGLLLSVLAAGVSVLFSLVLAPLAAMLAASLTTLLLALLALLALRAWPHALLAPEFVTLLLNRSTDSAGLAKVCALIGLRPTA